MNLKTTLIIFTSLTLINCSVDNEQILLPNDTSNLVIDDNNEPNGSINEVETELIAGQNMVSGVVNVITVDDVITVSYETEGDWVIEETHLFVGDLASLPTNGGGNPKIGRFPYADTHQGVTNVVYSTIDLLPNECVYVAAHAVVTNTATGQTETAWGYGIQIGGNSWAMMFEFCYDGGPF